MATELRKYVFNSEAFASQGRSKSRVQRGKVMDDKSTIELGGGLGFCSILTLIFVVSKILGAIDWSWWWVFSPLWIPVAVALAILLIIFIIAVLAGDGD